MHLEVIVIRQDGSVPVKYGLTMEMESRHAAIKPLLARLCGVAPSNLIVVDIVRSHLRPLAPEEQKVKSLNGACVFAYEFHSQPLSCNNNNSIRGSAGSGSQSFSDIQRSSRGGARGSSRNKKPNGAVPTSPLAQNRPPSSITPDSSISSMSSSSTGGGGGGGGGAGGEVSSREGSATASPAPPPRSPAAPTADAATASPPPGSSEPALFPLELSKPEGASSGSPETSPGKTPGEDAEGGVARRSGEQLLAAEGGGGGGEAQCLAEQNSDNGWSAQICMSGIAFCFKVVYYLQFL